MGEIRAKADREKKRLEANPEDTAPVVDVIISRRDPEADVAGIVDQNSEPAATPGPDAQQAQA